MANINSVVKKFILETTLVQIKLTQRTNLSTKITELKPELF